MPFSFRPLLLPFLVALVALITPFGAHAECTYSTYCENYTYWECSPYSYDSDICVEKQGFSCYDTYECTEGTQPSCADSGMVGNYPDCYVGNLPDLEIGTISPSFAQVGVPTTISAWVTNIGTQPTVVGIDTNFISTIFSPPQTFDTYQGSIAALAPGQSALVSFVHTFNRIGSFYVGMGASIAAGGPQESNTNNNGTSRSILVAAVPPPQCSDTGDNDNNGLTDYPADPGCTDASDNDESGGTLASVTCEVSATNVQPGGSVTYTATLHDDYSGYLYPWYTWQATDGTNSAQGGSWAGGDGNNQRTETRTFASAGTYGAKVTAHAGYGQMPNTNCPNVTVGTPVVPSVSCTVSPSSVPVNGSVTYTAIPANGAGAPYAWTASDGASGFGTGSSVTRSFGAMGTYGMSVQASGTGSPSATCSPQVSVDSCSGTKAGTLTANPVRVNQGSGTTLTWSAQNITSSCTISGPGVSNTVSAASCNVPSSSIGTPGLATQSIYTLTCDGTQLASVIVNVVPKIEEF